MNLTFRRPFTWVLVAVGGVALAGVLAFLFGLIVMALWNWLMPEIFGIRAISYWEAWGMVLLAHILFKAGAHQRHDRHDRARSDEWKDRFRRRFKDRFDRGGEPWSSDKDAEPQEPPRDPSGGHPPAEPGQA